MPLVADRTAGELRTQLERYLRHVGIERGRSTNTVAAYRRDLDGFLEFLGERGVVDVAGITTPAVTAFARGLRERPHPHAASSVARALSSVRGFTRFLVEEGPFWPSTRKCKISSPLESSDRRREDAWHRFWLFSAQKKACSNEPSSS